MKKIIFIFLILTGLISLSFVLDKNNSSVEKQASRVFNKCRLTSDKNVCYEREIPKLVKNLGMEASFDVATSVQQKDSNFYYCHVLGHNIASEETAKDPSKWKEVVSRCPAGVCSNGCIHGAFQEKFKQESVSPEKLVEIEKEIIDICEVRDGFDPSSLEQASCYHALGHLLMYITSADTNKSTELCRVISIRDDGRDFRGVCFDGVFMQMFQPLDSDDEALVYGKVPSKDQVFDYCKKFKEKEAYSCWNESWPLFLEEITTTSGIRNFCSKFPRGFEECFSDTLYILPIIFQFDLKVMSNFCSGLAVDEVKCFSTFANRILEIDYKNKQKSLEFCGSMSDIDDQKICTRELVRYAKFVFKEESIDLKDFCSSIPKSLEIDC